MWENDVLGKLRKISNFIMSQAETQTITITILPDISKTKDN